MVLRALGPMEDEEVAKKLLLLLAMSILHHTSSRLEMFGVTRVRIIVPRNVAHGLATTIHLKLGPGIYHVLLVQKFEGSKVVQSLLARVVGLLTTTSRDQCQHRENNVYPQPTNPPPTPTEEIPRPPTYVEQTAKFEQHPKADAPIVPYPRDNRRDPVGQDWVTQEGVKSKQEKELSPASLKMEGDTTGPVTTGQQSALALAESYAETRALVGRCGNAEKDGGPNTRREKRIPVKADTRANGSGDRISTGQPRPNRRKMAGDILSVNIEAHSGGLAREGLCADNPKRNERLAPAEKQDCLQHNTRNHKNRVFRLDLEVFQGENNKKYTRQKESHIGSYIVETCSNALYNECKRNSDNDEASFKKLEHVRSTLVLCLAGELTLHPGTHERDSDALQGLIDYQRVHAADLADSVGTCAAIDRVNRYMGASHSPAVLGKLYSTRTRTTTGRENRALVAACDKQMSEAGDRRGEANYITKLPPHWAFMDDVTTLLRTAPCTNRVLKRQEDVTVHIRIHTAIYVTGDRWTDFRASLLCSTKCLRFRQSVRTNNDVEGWHTWLNLKSKNPALLLYILFDLLHREGRLVRVQAR
ncbi:hypothetical protein Bbelb_018320 [Branchiostoma belcheri]|nr:hypothetical protein Bbelb_018320 [Branchiostoma belcheri]